MVEEPPERGSGDLHAVVEVGLPEAGNAQQFVAEGAQFQRQIAHLLQRFLFLARAVAAPL